MNASQILAAAPGLTYRQLDHWTTKGWLKARNQGDGTGRARDYPHSEATVAATMIRLAKAGLAPAKAALAARGESIGDGIYITINAPYVAPPAGKLAELLAVGDAHSLTLRGGRYLLDGRDVTDEYPVIGVA